MKKKSLAATVVVILSSLVFAVIGVCFTAFVYSKTKIVVENIGVNAVGFSVYNDKELKEKCTKLKLSDMELGLKPATGEIDKETLVPSTITDEGTSEGYYAKVFVPAGNAYKIIINNIEINTTKNKVEAEEERKNIFISIKDIKNSTKSLKEDEIELASFENVNETQQLTFLIWIGSLSGDELAGAKISFTLNFIKK